MDEGVRQLVAIEKQGEREGVRWEVEGVWGGGRESSDGDGAQKQDMRGGGGDSRELRLAEREQ